MLHLVEKRRQLVDDKMRFTNRLCHTLKQYYPQALEWFERHDTPMFCDFITQWPTLKQVKRARKASLERFFYANHVRSAQVIEKRIVAIKAAQALTEDAAVINAHSLQALTLVEQVRVTLEAIKRFDEAIAALAPKLPDYALFSALPGAGAQLAPRLLVAFGGAPAVRRCCPGHRA